MNRDEKTGKFISKGTLRESKKDIQSRYRSSDKAKETSKRYRQTLESKILIKANKLKQRYGITLNDYNNMFNEQNGCCLLCGKHNSELKKPLHVDHCHESKKVRGLLCTMCNFGLGMFVDDVELLQRAIVYLNKNKNNN